MKKLLALAAFLFTLSFSYARPYEDTARADASITNATVYFGYGAELTHESRVKVDAGTKIIVINQLSTQVDINSLQISCPEDIALLSQRYTVIYPVAGIVKGKDAERMEDSITLLQKQILVIDNQITVEQETLAKTGLLIETTVGISGKTETSAEVLKLVDFYNTKIEKSRKAIFGYQQESKLLNDRIADLRKRIAQGGGLAQAPARPYGQIILQVVCRRAEEIPVTLSYYTNNAGWTPLYDIRVNSKTNKVKLVYKALLTQTSGIDWKKTKLTLSTGTPNFGVVAPVLSPWYLQLYVPGLYTDLQRRAAVANNSRFNTIQSFYNDKALKEEVVVQGYGQYKLQSNNNIDPNTLQQYTTLNEGQLNTNFEIDLPYDIESDGQLHSVTIKNEEIDCTLKNYAVPRMDREAYLLAEVADWQNLDLLPGDANIIMDDTYVGKSVIDPNTTADTLNLSLGRDKRLAVKRVLVKELSSLKTSGKDSRQVFTYELTVKNNKLTDVNMLLKDQHPLSTIKEVEVQLEDAGGAMVNTETGVLTWKVALKPGESKKFRFTYSVKYPKDKKIVNLK
ncbi:MAG: DUF4139 domain-containing protein [Chitinophagaceae bacterium]